MKQYWVEGIVMKKVRSRKARKGEDLDQATLEPFCMSFWANSPEEALQAAQEKLNGNEWAEGPRLSLISEEQRMRAIGAPELPGFSGEIKKRKRKV